MNFYQRERMKDAMHTNDLNEIGRIFMETIQQEETMTAKPPAFFKNHDIEKRIEALELVRPLEVIYRKAYPNDERICMAIDGLVDYIAEKISNADLSIICSTVEQALHEAALDAEECPDRSINKYWKAADAAEALELATRPVLDMEELNKSVESALKQLNG